MDSWIKKLVFAVLLFSFNVVLSQTGNDKVTLIIKEKEHTRRFFSGQTSRSTHVVLYFRMGNSEEKKIGWRGKRLAVVLKKDGAAYHQFCIYKKTLNKKMWFKTTKIFSQFVTVVGAIVLFGSVVSENKNPAGTVIGGAAALAGVAGAILSSAAEYQLFNKAIDNLQKSVNIYNEDLEKKAGFNLTN